MHDHPHILTKCMRGAAFVAAVALAGTGAQAQTQTHVQFETTMGNFVIALDHGAAPKTARNFRRYVEDGFYDGTVFHRVIPEFVVQGGGFKPGFERMETRDPIENEADNGLMNVKYSLSMARTADPHSATSQFFINLVDNTMLDHPGQSGWGYAVFGNVIEGHEVIDRMGEVPTTNDLPHKNVPKKDIKVVKAYVIEPS